MWKIEDKKMYVTSLIQTTSSPHLVFHDGIFNRYDYKCKEYSKFKRGRLQNNRLPAVNLFSSDPTHKRKVHKLGKSTLKSRRDWGEGGIHYLQLVTLPLATECDCVSYFGLLAQKNRRKKRLLTVNWEIQILFCFMITFRPQLFKSWIALSTG